MEVAIHTDLGLFTRDGAAFTNSRDVAARFGKRHDDVLRAIRGLLKIEQGLGLRNFTETSYQEPSTGQVYPCFELDRDGFALLAMGFTGKTALRWKLRYIEAFNQMEAELRSQAVSLTTVQSGMAIVRLGAREFTVDLNDFRIESGDRALAFDYTGRYRIVSGPMESRATHAPIHARSAWGKKPVTVDKHGGIQRTAYYHIIGRVISEKDTRRRPTKLLAA